MASSRPTSKRLDDVVIETPCLFLTALYKIIEIPCFYKVLSGISQPAFIACKRCHFAPQKGQFRGNFERIQSAKISILHNYTWCFWFYIKHYDRHIHHRYGDLWVYAGCHQKAINKSSDLLDCASSFFVDI